MTRTERRKGRCSSRTRGWAFEAQTQARVWEPKCSEAHWAGKCKELPVCLETNLTTNSISHINRVRQYAEAPSPFPAGLFFARLHLATVPGHRSQDQEHGTRGRHSSRFLSRHRAGGQCSLNVPACCPASLQDSPGGCARNSALNVFFQAFPEERTLVCHDTEYHCRRHHHSGSALSHQQLPQEDQEQDLLLLRQWFELLLFLCPCRL